MTDTCMMIVGFMKSGLLITAPKLGVLTKTLEAIAAADQGRINILLLQSGCTGKRWPYRDYTCLFALQLPSKVCLQ